MGKADDYRESLKKQTDWDQYLLDESCLPGPRANLELVAAVAEEGNLNLFLRYLTYDSDQAPYGSALEFLPVCGAVGLGRLLSEGHLEYLEILRLHASDSRWRVREGVAMALQRLGETNMDELLNEMEKWSHGSLLEKRAVVAAICEPKLLKKPEVIHKVLELMNQITQDLSVEEHRKNENFKVLRKTLGYGWSVAVAAGPVDGKRFMEQWFANKDPDIRWIMRENLKKNRLSKMDPDWVAKWQTGLSK